MHRNFLDPLLENLAERPTKSRILSAAAELHLPTADTHAPADPSLQRDGCPRSLPRARQVRRTVLERLAKTWRAEGVRGVVARAGMRIGKGLADAFARLLPAASRSSGRQQTEEELIRDSAEYWNRGDRAGVDLKDYSHWQGAGPWHDRERWLQLGRPHVRLYEKLRHVTATATPASRVVEWGCGGGANAIHFIRDTREFCGVEISQASLDECRRVLHEAGFDSFRPVLIDADAPEQALQRAGDGYDLFLSTYVFELIPSQSYGERILRIAHQMLRPGGLALVQIRYDDGSERSSQKDRDYFRNSTRFTSYRIDQFWAILETIGFEPEFVWLARRQTAEFSGDLYAYFGMRKRESAASDATVVDGSVS